MPILSDPSLSMWQKMHILKRLKMKASLCKQFSINVQFNGTKNSSIPTRKVNKLFKFVER